MSDGVNRQSLFDRTLINESKLGAYYTDTSHCRRIGRLVAFDGGANVLEPSFGDASALAAVLESAVKPPDARLVTYGVELNRDSFSAYKDRLDNALHAEFITGCEISKGFSFCFSNPPYGTGSDEKDRLESLFVSGIYNAMTAGGLLVLVVSYPTCRISSFARTVFARFTLEGAYRFDDKEYAKFKQLALFLRRRRTQGYQAQEYEAFIKGFEELQKIPYLPEDQAGIYHVPATKPEQVELFRERIEDPKKTVRGLLDSPLYQRAESAVAGEGYRAIRLGRPPLPVGKVHKWTLAAAGCGQGSAGSIADGTYHLQRGTVKVVDETEAIVGDNGKVTGERITSHSKVKMSILLPSGNYFSLE